MDINTKDYVIGLLESYTDRKRKIAVLHFELDHAAQASKDEMLETMALGHGDGSGRMDDRISDKTLYIALNYQNRVDKLNADTKEEIVKELVELEQEQRRLDFYISLLSERQAKVIQLLYIQNLPQGEVEKTMSLSAKTVRKLKNDALDTLTGMYGLIADLT